MLSKLTADVLADLQTPTDVRLSPNGRHVVYSLANPLIWNGSVVSSLWLAQVDKENSARQITPGKSNDSSPQFSPDGRCIFFLSDRAKPGKASAIYLLPLDGGEALPLTSTDLDSGVKGYSWSPDGESIAFMSADKKSEERKKRDEEKDDAKVYGEDWGYCRLRSVSLESKEVQTVVSTPEHVSVSAWSPDGDKMTFCSYPTPELNGTMESGPTVKIINLADQIVSHLCHFQKLVSNLIWHENEIIWNGNYDQGLFSSSLSVYSIVAKSEQCHISRVGYCIDSCAAELRKCVGGVVMKVKKGLADQLQLLRSTTIYSEEHELIAWDVVIEGQKQTFVVIKGSTGVPQEVFPMANGVPCQLSHHNQEIAALNIGMSESYFHYQEGEYLWTESSRLPSRDAGKEERM